MSTPTTTVPGEPIGGPTQFPTVGGPGQEPPRPTAPVVVPPPPIAQPPYSQIYGSMDRIYPTWVPLNLDWLIQEGLLPMGLPISPAYPYAQTAGQYSSTAWNCNYQAYLDAAGVLSWYVGYLLSGNSGIPAPAACQHQAQISGYSFTLGGVVYTYNPNAPWTP